MVLTAASSIVPALLIASTAMREAIALDVPSVEPLLMTRFDGVPDTVVTVPLVSVALRKSRERADALIVRALAATLALMGWSWATLVEPGAANVPSPRRNVVVLLGGVGTPPPTVAVIVATLPVAIGVLKVWMPVNVFAASVLAMLALVVGNVIVVAFVPVRVMPL